MRDRYGITQIVCDKDAMPTTRRESVIQIEGIVKSRQVGQENKDMLTGDIEIESTKVKLFSESLPIPIDIDNMDNVSEDNRLKYRYLDLRRPQMKNNLMTRHKIAKVTRDFFDKHDFVEIETPILAKSTPEGARDYLVPSRVNKGKFYALPQSPQLFKQLLMVSGFDRYLQITKCFRDEDLRADRQPEFTQIDLEMSFVEQEDVLTIIEEYAHYLFKNVLNKEYPKFPRMTYEHAMENYGSDKPDIRFDLKLIDFTNELQNSEFKVFSGAKSGRIKGLFIEQEFSSKEAKKLEDIARLYKAKGLVTLTVADGKLDGSILKFLSAKEQEIILSKVGQKGTIFIVADANKKIAYDAIGKIRTELGSKFNLYDKNSFGFVWITDFPLFEWSEEEGRFMATHHPFTSPHPEDMKYIDDPTMLGNVRSLAYDLAVNGMEVGGGSIRIHDPVLQAKIFTLLGIDDDQAKIKFGYLLEAFKYGVPPHGGLAFGLDRLAGLMTGNESIKEVMAFPKNKAAFSPLDEAPNEVDDKQLKELGIKLDLD
jgi:aspartyl-tRNA synthetase